MISSSEPLFARPNNLFNFQGLKKRAIVASDFEQVGKQTFRSKVTRQEDDDQKAEGEELDLDGSSFDAYVRPSTHTSHWVSQRKHERSEINRLGDIVDFYQRKPHLTELEAKVLKRKTRCDKAMQTEVENGKLRLSHMRFKPPKIKLPPPIAMERVEEFLRENHWRLVDLFRTLDKEKTWNVVKQDFMRMAARERLDISEANADELIECFCRDAHVPMKYKQFVRGRSMYKKSLRENSNKTPSSIDTQLESDPSSRTSHYLRLPGNDPNQPYPERDSAFSAYSRSTKSSAAKLKSPSTSSSDGLKSQLST